MNFSINGRLSCLMTNQISFSNDSSNVLNMIYTILVSSTCPPFCTNLVLISFTFPTNLINGVFSSNELAWSLLRGNNARVPLLISYKLCNVVQHFRGFSMSTIWGMMSSLTNIAKISINLFLCLFKAFVATTTFATWSLSPITYFSSSSTTSSQTCPLHVSMPL